MDNWMGTIDEFKGAWRAIGRIAPERLSPLRQVATIESIGSSTRIEGAKLTDREIERLLSNLNVKSFKTRDEQEVAGYSEAMETVFAHWDPIGLTENHIRQLHRDLLKYSTRDERHRGGYKPLSNDVGAFDAKGKQVGVLFETATPFDTPRLMNELVSWTSRSLKQNDVHPLITIAIFVVSFLAVHPFQDGNGRLSRILTTLLLLLRSGYAYVPYSSLENIIEQTKKQYYFALRQTQGTLKSTSPDWHPWLTYFLGALVEQKSRLERKLSVSTFYLAICLSCRYTGASRNTIKDHVAVLTNKGHLVRHGAGRGIHCEPRATSAHGAEMIKDTSAEPVAAQWKSVEMERPEGETSNSLLDALSVWSTTLAAQSRP